MLIAAINIEYAKDQAIVSFFVAMMAVCMDILDFFKTKLFK